MKRPEIEKWRERLARVLPETGVLHFARQDLEQAVEYITFLEKKIEAKEA